MTQERDEGQGDGEGVVNHRALRRAGTKVEAHPSPPALASAAPPLIPALDSRYPRCCLTAANSAVGQQLNSDHLCCSDHLNTTSVILGPAVCPGRLPERPRTGPRWSHNNSGIWTSNLSGRILARGGSGNAGFHKAWECVHLGSISATDLPPWQLDSQCCGCSQKWLVVGEPMASAKASQPSLTKCSGEA